MQEMSISMEVRCNMSEYKETIVNAETGEVKVRDLTKAEIADLQSQQAELEERLKAIEEKNLARSAVLEKLGLTADEVKLLFG